MKNVIDYFNEKDGVRIKEVPYVIQILEEIDEELFLRYKMDKYEIMYGRLSVEFNYERGNEVYWLKIQGDNYDDVDKVKVESKRLINGGKGGYDNVVELDWIDVLDLDDELKYKVMGEKKRSSVYNYLMGE